MCVCRGTSLGMGGGKFLHSLHSVVDDLFSQNRLLSACTQSRVVWWCRTIDVYIYIDIKTSSRSHSRPAPSDSSVVRPPNRNNGRVVATAKHVDIGLEKEEIDQ